MRERFLRSDRAASLSEQALELSAEADRLQARDIVLYLEWRVALDGGDTATAEVIFGLFRAPLQSYLAAAPVDEAGLPLAPPFDDPEYDVVKRRAESDRFDAESENTRRPVGRLPGTVHATADWAFSSPRSSPR